MLVDVAINYYGKPYHTMVTIGSLLEHSGCHIGTVYLIKEAKQPDGADVITELLRRHDWDVEVFTPRYYFGWQMHPDWIGRAYGRLTGKSGAFAMRRKQYRWSVRYQYALEHTDKRYLFLTHNDVLFTGDALQPMLDLMNTGEHAGVGDIGACWKCPASAASLCADHQFSRLTLNYREAVELYERFPSTHRHPNLSRLDASNPVPFPECRLNEWFALLDVAAYLREAKPAGDTEPLGSFALGDTGIAWFRSMVHKGYSFAHATGPYEHVWTSRRGGGGHEALFDTSLYENEEAVAERYYLQHYAEQARDPRS